MRQSHLIISNAAIIWLTRLLILVPQLILVPYLIRRIGDEGYGVYVLAWSLMIAIDQLQNSLQQGVVKYSAAFLAQGRLDDVNKVASSSFVYSLFLSLVAFVGVLGAAFLGTRRSGDVFFAMAVMAVVVLLAFPLTPYIAIIQSRQRYFVNSIAEVVTKYGVLFAVIAWFSVAGPSVRALIVISAVGMLFARLGQVPVARRLVPGLRVRPALFDREIFGLLASFGLFTVLLSLCLIANDAGVKWISGVLASKSFVAHLAIILMPSVLLSQVIQAATIVVMPAASVYEATGNRAVLREMLVRGTRYSTILSLAALIVAAFLMKDVLRLWIGPDYVFLAPFALALLLSMALRVSTSTGHHMLKGIGKIRTVVYIYLASLGVVPLLLIPLGMLVFQNPYYAVTVGLVSGNIICGLFQTAASMKAVEAGPREVLLQSYLNPMLAAAGVFLSVWVVVAAGGIDGFSGRLGTSLAAGAIFLAACYLFISTPQERREAREIFRAARKRFSFEDQDV